MSKLLKDYDYTKFEYNELQEHIDAALSDCSWAKDDYNNIEIKSWEDVPAKECRKLMKLIKEDEANS